MSDSILEYSLTEVAAGIRRKEFSSEEVTRNCLEKIEKLQSKLNCFISIYAEEAIEAARRADKAIASGDEINLSTSKYLSLIADNFSNIF